MADESATHSSIRVGIAERREYQERIVKTSLRENTLIILPTGLGKTVIAAMIAVERLRTFPDGRILVLAPTRPLVEQHCMRFKEFLNLDEERFFVLTGMVSPEKRIKAWSSGRIFFLTPQVLERDLIGGRLSLENFVLAVFDEGHRTIGNYPYVFIANQYMSKAKNPRIIGLTASPGHTKETIEEIRRNLFATAIESRTDSSYDVTRYVMPTKLEWKRVALPRYFIEVQSLLESLIDYRLKTLTEKGLAVNGRFHLTIRELLKLKDQIQLENSKQIPVPPENISLMKNVMTAIYLMHGLELLQAQGFLSAKRYFDKLNAKAALSGSTSYLRLLFFDERMQRALDIIREKVNEGFDHPKVGVLLETIDHELKENGVRRIIVFTNYRETARRLANKINELLQDSTSWFIGHSSKPQDEGLSEKEQLKVLSDFREGKFKVLVATQVAEEGLDISECDLVIFYDNVPSAIRFIQRRGRTGRSASGRIVILMAEKTKDEAYYWIARSRERKMREILTGMQQKTKKDAELLKLDQFISQKEEVSAISNEKKIRIHVDNRESSSLIARELLTLGVDVTLSNLPVGDYILSDRVAVERKNANDLISSIIDRRLFDQLKALKGAYSIPLLLIEGTDLFGIRDMHPEAIRGAIASVVVDYGISMLWTMNQTESAQMLYTIAKREQTERENRVTIRGEKKPPSIKEMQEFLVAGLPNVDSVLGKRLLEHFGSVEGVFAATKECLMEVPGIGKKIAEKIRLVASHTYGEELSDSLESS